MDGGGFASTRTRIDSSPHTLRLQTGSDVFLVLDVTGDGQQYKVGLRESDQVRQPTWQAAFNTAAQQRVSVMIPMVQSHWHGSIMGRFVNVPIDFSRVRGISIMLSLVDVMGKQMPRGSPLFHDGPFRLVVHSMRLQRR